MPSGALSHDIGGGGATSIWGLGVWHVTCSVSRVMGEASRLLRALAYFCLAALAVVPVFIRHNKRKELEIRGKAFKDSQDLKK